MSLLAGLCFGFSLGMLSDIAQGGPFYFDENRDLGIALWLFLIACAILIYEVSI